MTNAPDLNQATPAAGIVPNQIQLTLRHRGDLSAADLQATIDALNRRLGTTLSRVNRGEDVNGQPLFVEPLRFQRGAQSLTVVLLDAGLPSQTNTDLATVIRGINAAGSGAGGGLQAARRERGAEADDVVVRLIRRWLESLRGIDSTFQGPALSAAPNRVLAPAHHGGGFGGPGTWPSQPLTASVDYLATKLDALRAQLAPRGARQPVTVAVLDTWLTATEVAGALSAGWGQADLTPGSGLSFVNHLRLSDAARANLAALRSPTPPPNQYLKRSHGLFAASQIMRLAPDVPVMVYEALDEYGMGTVFHILEILWHLHDTYRAGNLVVNLSLTVRPLPGDADWSSVIEPLAEICQTLTANGAVLVAAAGNDSFGSAQPLPPAEPAAFPSVIGVGAVAPAAAGFERAPYSNLCGLPTAGGAARAGFMTVGGGVRNGAQSPPDGLQPTDHVHGPFVDASFPSGPLAAPVQQANATGVVTWAGTSFATAKLAGLIAALLANGHIRPSSGCGCWPLAPLLTQQTTKDAVINVLHRTFVRQATPVFNEPIVEI